MNNGKKNRVDFGFMDGRHWEQCAHSVYSPYNVDKFRYKRFLVRPIEYNSQEFWRDDGYRLWKKLDCQLLMLGCE